MLLVALSGRAQGTRPAYGMKLELRHAEGDAEHSAGMCVWLQFGCRMLFRDHGHFELAVVFLCMLCVQPDSWCPAILAKIDDRTEIDS